MFCIKVNNKYLIGFETITNQNRYAGNTGLGNNYNAEEMIPVYSEEPYDFAPKSVKGKIGTLIESGADVKTTSTILGHAKVATTMDLYVHPSDENKRNVLENAFKGI